MDPDSGKLYPSVQAAKDAGVQHPVELRGRPQDIQQVSAAVSSDASRRQGKSPYCMRCNKKRHGGFKHEFHETSEHDAWWERTRPKNG